MRPPPVSRSIAANDGFQVAGNTRNLRCVLQTRGANPVCKGTKNMDVSAHIQEHMEVVGSDGTHVGTVDHMEGNRVKLTRSDPSAGGQHHYLALDQIDHVEQDKVCLNIPGEQAKKTWQS